MFGKERILLWISLVCSWTHYTDANSECEESQNVHITFQTKRCAAEYIVLFHNYYDVNTRKRFISAALQRANINDWKVVERTNAASRFPSDFDVLHIKDDNNHDWELSLRAHPAIKSVSAHKMIQRSLSFSANENDTSDYQFHMHSGRRLLRVVPRQITATLQADALWKLGITGRGIKVAVFDTGLSKDHPHFRRVKERTNWTNEKSLDDGVSHGTFVAGVIASAKECLGFAPDAELHIYRVFTNTQVSYTSWFLDAFNYAIFRKINILNLSIGGPDFLDQPFVDKVLELSANKVIMVSAIGNDGPLYGTLNNPGDQSDVIGVGGINFDEKVAKFSSRGMTTWELPFGYGRLKPDIVTFGSQVKGSNVRTGCRTLSGTSVASPVVAGAITLIASGALHRLDFVNPASMKQVLIEGATRLPDNNMFEQGHGKLNIIKSMQLLITYVPRVTLSPAYLDFRESYMWPYSSQPMFCGSMPVIVNVTVLNGVAVTGKIAAPPEWHAYSDKHGNVLDVAITYSSVLWPWSGWMAVHIGVNQDGCDFEGVAQGHISLVVENPSPSDEGKSINDTIYFPLSVKVIPKPPRHKRMLWDQYHSLRYPPGYIPRDNLKIKADPLDWRADHIHTNFRDMYNHLRSSGYYVDILGQPYSCFNASEYGTLLIVDPEEEFFDDEITKLQNDVYDTELSIILFADWYNTTVMKKIKFFDENTRQWWIPDTGGANIPALNELLKPYGIALGDLIAEGHFTLGDHSMYYASGATITKMPEDTDSIIIGAELNDQGVEIIEGTNPPSKKEKDFVPILGLFQTKQSLRKKYLSLNSAFNPSSYETNTAIHVDLQTEQTLQERNPILNKRVLLSLLDLKKFKNKHVKITKPSVLDNKVKVRSTEGRLAVFGDSNCLDSTHLEKACFWLLDALLEYTMNSYKSGLLQNLNRASEFQLAAKKTLPLRLASSNLHHYSRVLNETNKFQKLQNVKCHSVPWAKANVISSKHIDMTILMNGLRKDNMRNFQSNKDYQDPKTLELVLGLNTGEKHAHKSGEPYHAFEDDSMSYSFIFVILLSFVVLALFIHWFRRRRKLNPLLK